MTQHPVPQNISSYEFHLVGDMTLKQFFQVAGGLALAALFYRLPLPSILKLPLMGLSALTGVLLAFVPVQGRPFSQWLTAFFKAVYSPTEYVWRQSVTINSDISKPLSTEHSALSTNPLDKLETQLFSRITELFNSSTFKPSVQTTPQPMTTYDNRVTTNDAPKPTPTPPRPHNP